MRLFFYLIFYFHFQEDNFFKPSTSYSEKSPSLHFHIDKTRNDYIELSKNNESSNKISFNILNKTKLVSSPEDDARKQTVYEVKQQVFPETSQLNKQEYLKQFERNDLLVNEEKQTKMKVKRNFVHELTHYIAMISSTLIFLNIFSRKKI